MRLKHEKENGVREQGIREWEKKKESMQLRIIELKRKSEPLYESMGRILDGTRVEHKELDLWYFQIDGVNKAIQNLQAQIEKLQ